MSNNPNSKRLAAPKGTMTRGANSGPAIMLLPPGIRACFIPQVPLGREPHVSVRKRKHPITGVAAFLPLLMNMTAATRTKSDHPTSDTASSSTSENRNGQNHRTIINNKEQRRQKRLQAHAARLQPLIDAYRDQQRECGGEFQGMNCYHTLFVGRLAYEVTDRKLLREMEVFGPIVDIRMVTSNPTPNSIPTKENGLPPGASNETIISSGIPRTKYAFIEYEKEDDMKRAYRAADGMKLEGREIVVDVERGHTVPTWLPRRLGGGLGGTRLGGKDVNVTRPGRYDPQRPDSGGFGNTATPMVESPSVRTGHGSGASSGMMMNSNNSSGGYGPPPPQYPSSHHPGMLSSHHPHPSYMLQYGHPPPPQHSQSLPPPSSYYQSPSMSSSYGGNYGSNYGGSGRYGSGGGDREGGGRDWNDRDRDRSRDRDRDRDRTKRPRSISPDRRHGRSSNSGSRHRSSRH